ncbi:MAG: hypothetical protein N3D11_02580 [Candidatus Sumerlaeia bacterium]|nr:hypothetical protein [Candidatus Sumerlaeia bacterium]
MLAESLEVTLRATETLESFGIPYVIGGSLACAVHGLARATLDAHIEAIQAASRQRDCFNIVHRASMFKVDIFVPPNRPFDQVRLSRRVRYVLPTEPEKGFFVSTPENTLLAKLGWFRLGNEVSECQWRDMRGILRLHAGQLNAII